VITAFGSDSHLRDKPASELILQALTGAMGYVGSADQPPYRVGMNVAAAAAGVAAAQAIFAALIRRSRMGEGQAVEISEIIALLSLMNNYIASRSDADEPVLSKPCEQSCGNGYQQYIHSRLPQRDVCQSCSS
jgi:crotonobetainyl-CoA:carnitine CoA-transferase CaiB-like acyl-CoA transferase